MNKNPPQLVVFVGGHNNAGKSSVIAAIISALQAHGIECKQLVSRIDDTDQIDIFTKDDAFLENNLEEIAKKDTFVETVELTGLETAQLLETLRLTPVAARDGATIRVSSTFEYHRLPVAND